MESSNVMVDKKKQKPMPGCGFRFLCGAVFHRRSRTEPRRSPPGSSSPQSGVSRAVAKLAPFHVGRRREEPDQAPLIVPGDGVDSLASARKPRLSHNPQTPGRRKAAPRQGLPRVQVDGISTELDGLIYDHQRTKESSSLIRASSGNVMLFGNLGNLRIRGSAAGPACNLLDELPKTAKEASSGAKTRLSNVGGGADSVMSRSGNAREQAPVPTTSPSLSKRFVPEELNHRGSVEYRKGRFPEALAFFEQATITAPETALYWNNKAVVLTGLGRFLEAVDACSKAVKLDPSYCRAHYRLATIYLRLGEAGRAMHHYQQAEDEASTKDISQARSLQNHLTKCSKTRNTRDWHNLLKEALSAVSAGAYSAPKVFAAQAEALLRLQRHQEADTALANSPTFDIDASIKFFGPAANTYILVVRAQVDMALGRFSDAVSNAHRAAKIDPRNPETTSVVRRACAVSLAREKGNDHFKASKFGEACAAYGEGLDHDPQNSVLLCSRAACQSKLGKWEKAIEDCSLALNVRPLYKKARLRRAGYCAKLERWEDSIHDYKVLIQQLPGDQEVLKALAKVHSQLKDRDTESEDINPCAIKPAPYTIFTRGRF